MPYRDGTIPEGDKHFEKQRHTADTSDANGSTGFYDLMYKIGREMHASTDVFNIPEAVNTSPSILDLCMAPGCYLSIVLKHNPGAHATALSLRTGDGEHKVLLSEAQLTMVDIKWLELMFLAVDMEIESRKSTQIAPISSHEHCSKMSCSISYLRRNSTPYACQGCISREARSSQIDRHAIGSRRGAHEARGYHGGPLPQARGTGHR
jgi:hypothetical protein